METINANVDLQKVRKKDLKEMAKIEVQMKNLKEEIEMQIVEFEKNFFRQNSNWPELADIANDNEIKEKLKKLKIIKKILKLI